MEIIDFSLNPKQSKEKDAISEVLHDPKKILEKGINFMQNVNERMDICVDSNAPSNIITIPYYYENYLKIKRRGCKIRFITQITNENLVYCKQLLTIVNDLRHLDVIKGGISVTETEYMSTTQIIQKRLTVQCIYSNNPAVIEQGQYIFESFWGLAIPAITRIRELEKGLKREYIETIKDPLEVEKSVNTILRSTTDEIMIIFSNSDDHNIQIVEYFIVALQWLMKTSDKVNIQVLVHKGKQTIDVLKRSVGNPYENEKIKIRFLKDSIKTSLVLLISDRMTSLVIETKDKYAK